jgi:hypothetical protein
MSQLAACPRTNRLGRTLPPTLGPTLIVREPILQTAAQGLLLGQDDAEAIIEAVAILDSDRLREAACDDGEVVSSASRSLARIASAPVSISPSSSGVDAPSTARETGTNGRNTGCPRRVCWGPPDRGRARVSSAQPRPT